MGCSSSKQLYTVEDDMVENPSVHDVKPGLRFKMSFISRFNKYIGANILSEWLSVKDIAYLDVAVSCNVREKQTITGWYREFSIRFSQNLFHPTVTLPLSIEFCLWSYKYEFDCSRVIFYVTEKLVGKKYQLQSSGSSKLQYLLTGFVKRLQLRNLPEITTEYLEEIGLQNVLTKLEELQLFKTVQPLNFISNYQNLRNCQINARYVREVCLHCPDLTVLEVSNYPGFDKIAILSIIIYARKLQHLKFFGMKVKLIEQLFEFHCKAPLKSLIWPDMCMNYGITPWGSKLESLCLPLSSELLNMKELATHCPNLTYLDIRRWKACHSLLVLILPKLPQLVHLYLCDDSDQNCSSFVLNGIKNCQQLKSLKFSKFVCVNEELVQLLSFNLPQLESLEMIECGLSDFESITILQHHPLLTKLNVSYNNSVTDGSFSILGGVCKQLKELIVASTAIGDVGLTVISQQCKRLTYLDVTDCNSITDAGIRHVLKWSSVPFRNVKHRMLISDDTNVFDF